jgi:hypothetical protein
MPSAQTSHLHSFPVSDAAATTASARLAASQRREKREPLAQRVCIIFFPQTACVQLRRERERAALSFCTTLSEPLAVAEC